MTDEGTIEEENTKPSVVAEKLAEETNNMITAYFLFSLVWSFGATIEGSSRIKFDEFFRSLCEMDAPNSKYPRFEIGYLWAFSIEPALNL